MIRDAAEADAERCAAIYAPYVRDTAISFETEPPPAEEMARRIARGHRTALAGIALPNEASTGLHRALGFEPVGTYRRVGWKHGRWHDVAWYQRALGDDDGPPEPLR